MTKHYCDKCKEETDSLYSLMYRAETHKPSSTVFIDRGNTSFEVCRKCLHDIKEYATKNI